MLAKVMNVRWKRWGELLVERRNLRHGFSRRSRTSSTMIIYVLCNPVQADLVERVSDWPGCLVARVPRRAA